MSDMENSTNSDLSDDFVDIDQVIDQQRGQSVQKSSFPLSENNPTEVNDNHIEESIATPVLKEIKWRIVKLPFKNNSHPIISTVWTSIWGHSIKLNYNWSKDDEAVVYITTNKLNAATENDLKLWQAASFSIIVGKKVIKAAAHSSDSMFFKLGGTTDIQNMLDGEDLVLKLVVSTDQLQSVERPEFSIGGLEAKSIGKVVALVIVVIILALSTYFGRSEIEETFAQQHFAVLQQSIINLNTNVKKMELDVSRLVDIIDNHEKQLRKFNVRLAAIVERRENVNKKRRENVFINIIDDMKKSVCSFSKRFLPKQLQMTSCLDSGFDLQY